MKRSDEGWAKDARGKWHFFVKGRSVCFEALPAPAHLHSRSDSHEIQCAACHE